MDSDTDQHGLRFSEEQYHQSGRIYNEENALSSDEPKGETFTFGLDDSTDCLRYKGKKYEDLQFSDFNSILFRSVDDVERFYAYHSIAKGFSVRKSKSDKDRDGEIFRRSLCCSKQGWRTVNNPAKRKKVFGSAPSEVTNKEQQPIKRKVTRCGCPARLTVIRCKTTGYFYVSQFQTDHNHVLVPKEMVHLLRSNRMVGEHASAQVRSLKKVSVPTCRAYDLLVHQAGGYPYVGFTIKDLYNQQDSERRELLVDGDAQAAISFMNLKASRDPHFYCYFCVDQEGRLANLFWRDSKCLVDYNNFGDVLIMDSTYKTNIYGKPLVVFVGVNNHRATVLFGCALLVDETEETFKWVVSTFISSMDGKKPISVITDQDDAMRNAIVELIPEARYRLCAWHISKNVIGKIHDVNVQRDFSHLIYAGLSVSEWESYWNYVVAMAGLQDNRWVIGMFNKRERWAEAFFREDYFAGVRSTQRCEQMHRDLKTGMGKQMRLYEVLPRLDKTMDRIRERVLYDDFISINASPVIGDHMRLLQEQIGKKFTNDIFLLIQDQIRFESRFFVQDEFHFPELGSSVVTLTQYGKPHRKWNVTYRNNNDNPTLSCTCKLFESDGIPCCHIFAVMKVKQITVFPESLVTIRWTKDATTTNVKTQGSNSEIPDHSLRLARYGEMMAECTQTCFRASYSEDAYYETIESMRRMSIRARRYPVHEDQDDTAHNSLEGLHENVVKDPTICTSKGTRANPPTVVDDAKVGLTKGGIKCGKCHQPGHNVRTCEKTTNDAKGWGKSHRDNVVFDSSADHTSPGEDEYETSGSSDNTNYLLHHNEEARDFAFFGGYDNIIPSLSTSR